jgi:formylglycine-generating enzyme required for sulfatase activity
MRNLRYLVLAGVLIYSTVCDSATASAQEPQVPEGMVLVPAGAFQMAPTQPKV